LSATQGAKVEDILQRTATPEWQILLRLTIALVLGGAVGFDRERKNRPAGLRTHMLIALAAALVAVTTIELSTAAHASGGSADTIRAIEAVTAGVAFLAAGTIFQARGNVIGLTTGAGMWLSGTIGVACGFGHFITALFATILALIVLAGLQKLSEHINPVDHQQGAKK
jgi:putative Mg2+ transporter-C (MgtC) family protein